MRSSTPSPPRHSAPVPRERARAGPHQAPLNEGGGRWRRRPIETFLRASGSVRCWDGWVRSSIPGFGRGGHALLRTDCMIVCSWGDRDGARSREHVGSCGAVIDPSFFPRISLRVLYLLPPVYVTRCVLIYSRGWLRGLELGTRALGDV